jgi:fructuronate reductase
MDQTTPLLSQELLEDKNFWSGKTVARPAYKRNRLVPRMLHLAPGAFPSAHVFKYFHDMLEQNASSDWGIAAVETFNPALSRALKEQDGLYTLIEMPESGDFRHTVVGSVIDAFFAGTEIDGGDWERVLDLAARPELKLITLTCTEKGYSVKGPPAEWDLSTGKTDLIMSKLTALLHNRYRRLGPEGLLTVLSCDNLAHNGKVLRSSVETVARAWIEAGLVEERFMAYLEKTPFPSSMVDRITPATTPEALAEYQADLGYRDSKAINAEDYRLWVIEDNFAGDRPPLEPFGVLYVSDVTPYENMKLRLLNATHTTMAVIGPLLGHQYIYQAITDPDVEKLVKRIVFDEVIPVLDSPSALDPKEFAADSIARFRNPNVPHMTQQIAIDTSQKVKQRLALSLADIVKAGNPPPAGTCLAIAGWFRYLLGMDDNGESMPVSSDPLKEELQGKLDDIKLGDPDSVGGKLKPILSDTELFGVNLTEIGAGEQIESNLKQMLQQPGAVRTTLNQL